MRRGEEVRVLVHYDLFGLDLKDKIGMYVATDKSTQKHLCVFEENGEWAELEDSELEFISPGNVPSKNINLAARIKKLEYSYPL